MNVTITRIVSGDAAIDSHWLVLQGAIDGVPAVAQRRSIALAALAAGRRTLEAEKAALVADVEAAYTRYQALQSALEQL